MKHILSLAIVFYLLSGIAQAQSPKREFRGAWIATVGNIDWPKEQGLPAGEQQQQFIDRLDQLKALGCNAVIVQIRPACDAFYSSALEPWSHYLSGKQGVPPTPFYDPLEFMLTEAHKRNMEFHAWFNPFRALVDSKNNPNPADHVTRAHSAWIISYGGKSYIDPGIPEARDYVVKVMADVVKRYDIDAVHLDDYFYPYRIAGKVFGDGKSYAAHGKGMDREDWRRDNVNTFVHQLNIAIKQIKPYMKLGISPFGIWRNKNKDPEGSDTRGGQTNYDDLYADVLMWMQKGWIDYMMPQLYWEHNHNVAPFGTLMPWWYNHCFSRHVYYGLGLYRMTNAKSGPWASAHEMMWQLRDIRGKCPNSGYSFYSASCFDKIRQPLKDSLRNDYARYPALVPPMIWLDSVAPAPPVVTISSAGSVATLKWQQNNPRKEAIRYVVYRFSGNEPIDLERNDRIISIQQNQEFTDNEAKRYKQPVYVVTSLDRMWNESKPSNKVTL